MVGGTFWWSTTHVKNINSGKVTIGAIAPLRTFIEVGDIDGDRIPDWQDALASGEVIDLDEISSTSPYAPDTETGKALIKLTEKYLMAKAEGGDISSQKVADETSLNLSLGSIDPQYEKKDINLIPNNDAPSLRRYGNGIVQAIIDQPIPVGTRNELEILNDALIKDDEKILTELDPIIEAYTGTLNAMLVMPVPDKLAIEHVALTNVYRAILEDIKAFRYVFDDAVPSMLRTRRYPADNIALYTAITNLYEKIDSFGIKWSSADIASTLIKVE